MRQLFLDLAKNLKIPFLIIDCCAPLEEMKDRVVVRKNKDNDASDADLSVLDFQLMQDQAFTSEETKYLYSLNTGKSAELSELVAILKKLSN